MKAIDVDLWLRQNARAPDEIELGLERVAAVRSALRLSLPMPVITVGGTNGKGSVCALLNSMLCAAGYQVGCYTSPHILHFSERIQINQNPVDAAQILQALERTAAAAAQHDIELTYFELTTLAAAQLFEAHPCEVVILEVGLGGRLDAVNVFEPSVAVITNVEKDHMEFLGNTREQIAGEKAGIARRGKPLIIGSARAAEVVVPHILQNDSRGDSPRRDSDSQNNVSNASDSVFVNGEHFRAAANDGQQNTWDYHGIHRTLKSLPMPALRGAHQVGNAAVACAALEALPADYWVGNGGVRSGLHQVKLVGRAQVLAGKPCVVVDVAHNVAAAAELEQFLFNMGYFPQTRAVLGMLNRKDCIGFVQALSRRIDHWYIAAPRGGDKPAEVLAAEVCEAIGNTNGGADKITICESIAAATQLAYAASDENDRILVSGSFLTVADFYQHYQTKLS